MILCNPNTWPRLLKRFKNFDDSNIEELNIKWARDSTFEINLTLISFDLDMNVWKRVFFKLIGAEFINFQYDKDKDYPNVDQEIAIEWDEKGAILNLGGAINYPDNILKINSNMIFRAKEIYLIFDSVAFGTDDTV
ncbi:hypothetical protein WJT86_12200 [Microvirga sp. W0021]|uniref:Uncharacterized protein n=1 Tax=Hohaiivirga grylli TaxID=3133970 RepID=A0ABV0BMK2_9HYPH